MSSPARTKQKSLEDFVHSLMNAKDLTYGKKVSQLFAKLDGIDLYAETSDSCRAVGQMLVRLGAEPEAAFALYGVPVDTTKLWLSGHDQTLYTQQSIIMGLSGGLATRLSRAAPTFKNVTPTISRPADQNDPVFILKRAPR